MPVDGTAEASTGSRKEFSAVLAAMLVLSVGIGVAGLIGIIVACRKKKTVRRNKRVSLLKPHRLDVNCYKRSFVYE